MAAGMTATEVPPGVRHRRRAPWIAAGMLLPVVILVGVLATRAPATTRLADSPLLGRPAPVAPVTTLDGQPFRLANLRGRWVLVNFFATWCVPCRKEHPDLIRFHERHAAAGDASVVGVVYDDSTDAVRQFRDQEGGGWPMLQDPDGQVALDFGVRGVPESFLVTPGGIVAGRVVGGVRAAQLEDLLADAKARFRQ